MSAHEPRDPADNRELAGTLRPTLRYIGFRSGLRRIKDLPVRVQVLAAASLVAMFCGALLPQISVFVFLLGICGLIGVVVQAERLGK